MQINKVGVVGCGAMGAGIIQAAAQAGCDVVGVDIEQSFLDGAQKTIERFLRLAVRKQKTMSQEEADAALSRISFSLERQALADCDLVIEAIVENMDVKKSLFSELNDIVKPTAIFATNTSSLSVTEMAEASGRPAQFCGTHFFNPVPVMALLEVIRTPSTAPETLESIYDLGKRMKKEVVTAKDTPAFIVNFLLMTYLISATKMLEQGVASRDDIDTAIKLGLNHPMGPFELLDIIGIDVAVKVADAVVQMRPETANYFAAPQLLRDMVAAGKLGKKTQGGFHDYGNGGFAMPELT